MNKTAKVVNITSCAVISALTVITGALFIWQSIAIYLSAPSEPYSREVVAAAITRISPAIWLWLVSVLVGGILCLIYPLNTRKRAYNDSIYAFDRIKKRIPANCDGEYQSQCMQISFTRRAVNILWLACAVFCTGVALYAIIYLAIPSNFSTADKATEEVLRLVKHVLPLICAAFILACAATAYQARCAKNILPTAKKVAAAKLEVAPKTGFFALRARVQAVTKHKYFKLGVRVAIGCVAVSFIIAGAFNGNMRAVFVKAASICMECIGLG